MAIGATVHHFQIVLSDVDRNVYETLDLRLARHPSESSRYLWTRTLAYCLCYEPGITFSKGGLSASDEPPISIQDAHGLLRAWIDVGSPSAERLHRAAKAAPRVAVFSTVDLRLLQKEAASRPIHRLQEIELWLLQEGLLNTLAELLEKNLSFELVRNEEQLYLSFPGKNLNSNICRATLLD